MAKFVPVTLSHKIFEANSGSDTNLSPIIFIHGVTATKENWENIPQVIADKTRRKTIIYDARNHGDSEYSEEFSFDLNIDDIFHFMDSMKIQKAILVGHSMGGITAAVSALKKPERVKMIFVEDMFVKKFPQKLLDVLVPFIALRAESVKNIPKDLNEEEAKQFSNDYMISKLPDNSPLFSKKEDLYRARVFLKKKPDGGYDLKFNVNAIIKALRNTETLMSEPDGVYAGPAYFLYGNKSPVKVNAEENSIKKHFPYAELIEFDGATHNVHLEFPEKFVNEITTRIQNKSV